MEIGEVVGPFEIEAELGSGAMGSVYKARVVESGRVVALKVIAYGLVGNEAALKRFEREASILKQLRHPHIVRLFATGTYRKTPFFAMEFVEGESLDHVQARRGRFTWEEVVEIGKQLCAALQHAHEKGIVHRDLKPSNLMITTDGVLKLTDFGIAKDTDVTALTGANSTIGTAAYMSPEQCKGEKTLGPKSDIYSFGIVLYELLTGKKPFTAESAVDMFMMHVNGRFERPSRVVLDVPVWLDNLVCQMMEKKPEHRPLDAAMVARALEEVAEKVSNQKSAGVVIANARAIDRQRMNNPADEQDVEAAKALREGTGKKKKKGKKAKPKTFFEKKWVQALGLIAAIVTLCVVAIMMTQPEKPEELIARVDELSKAGNRAGAVRAAQDYIAEYGDRTDETTERIRRLSVSAEVIAREAVLAKRHRNNLRKPDDVKEGKESYEAAMIALDAEEEGNIAVAKQQWRKAAELAPDRKTPEGQLWANVSWRKLQAIDEATNREATLLASIRADDVDEKRREISDEAERLGVEALRFEKLGDPWRARSRWEGVRTVAGTDPEKRGWVLLAGKKGRELNEELKGQPRDAEGEKRVEMLESTMAKAETMRQSTDLAQKRDARNIWRDIRDLYDGDADKQTQPFVKQANAALKQAK